MVGSSSNSSRGAPTRLAPRSKPPALTPRIGAAATVGHFLEAELFDHDRRGALAARLRVPEEPGRHHQVLTPGHGGLHRRVLPGQADAAADGQRIANDIVPRTRNEPLVGPMRVATVRTNVVLPAPFGPRMASTSPGGATEVQAVERGDLPEPDGETAGLEERRSPVVGALMSLYRSAAVRLLLVRGAMGCSSSSLVVVLASGSISSD